MQVASLIATRHGVAVAEDAEHHLARPAWPSGGSSSSRSSCVSQRERRWSMRLASIEAQEGVERQAAARDRLGQRGEARVGAARRRPPGAGRPPRRRGRRAARPRRRGLVAEVVGGAAERVDRAHVGAHVARRQQEGDREVLVVGPRRRPRAAARPCETAPSPQGPAERAHREDLPVEVVVDHEVHREPGAGVPGLVPGAVRPLGAGEEGEPAVDGRVARRRRRAARAAPRRSARRCESPRPIQAGSR